MKVVRRLGSTPQQRGSANDVSCPDIFELEDGQIAVIGTDVTGELDHLLPAGSSCRPGARIVVITRETMLRAKGDIAGLA